MEFRLRNQESLEVEELSWARESSRLEVHPCRLVMKADYSQSSWEDQLLKTQTIAVSCKIGEIFAA